MTAISAIISKEWIAMGSDSLLTEIQGKKVKHIEFRKSKLIPIQKFRGIMSYWGFAKYGNWRTYDFLKTMSTEAQNFNDIEDFIIYLKTQLEEKLNSFNLIKDKDKGIGIHFSGYLRKRNDWIPYFYLISNYDNPSYSKVGKISYSERLYNTLPSSFQEDGATTERQQEIIVDFLNKDGWFIFNNGDPELFNPGADGILRIFEKMNKRSKFSTDQRRQNFLQLVSAPISLLKDVQKIFLSKGDKRIGGKIHNLLVQKNDGKYFSDTGDEII